MKLNSQLMSLLANRLDLRMTEGGVRVMEGEGRECGMCTALLSGEQYWVQSSIVCAILGICTSGGGRGGRERRKWRGTNIEGKGKWQMGEQYTATPASSFQDKLLKDLIFQLNVLHAVAISSTPIIVSEDIDESTLSSSFPYKYLIDTTH